MIRRFILALAAMVAVALPLTACATLPTPSGYADQTKVDEQAGLTITLAYTAAARAAALTIRTADAIGKPLPPATIQCIGQLNKRAYAGVLAVRQAYLAANAPDYVSALAGARVAISDLLAATTKGTMTC